MALQIRRYGRSFLILILLAFIGLGAGFYILIQQRLPNPFKSFYQVQAAFPTAAAVVPGLGEPVDVAGVHVGEILGATLRGGQGVVQMEIDPTKGVPHLFKNAHAVLVPNTPLKDMYIDISPGSPNAGILPNNAVIPVAETTSPIDSDELLDSLDVDTRDWFTSLITELNNGTEGRGEDIRKLLMTLGPTSAQLREVSDLIAQRRYEVADLVHNLATLTRATAVDDTEIGTVVRDGDTTIHALASQDAALQQSITKLPAVLHTTGETLTDLTGFSNQLGPTATALLPTAHDLPRTLRDAKTLIQGAALLPLSKIKAFEGAVIPLAKELPGVATGLKTAVPELTTSFKVLKYVTNELAYDPGNGNPGFLYWLAWFSHNVDSFIGNSDANGPAWRGLVETSCTSLKSFAVGPLLEDVLGTTFGCS